MTRAIVFAYHNVGYRCLSTLLAHGVSVGGELDYLDEGTLSQALRARTAL